MVRQHSFPQICYWPCREPRRISYVKMNFHLVRERFGFILLRRHNEGHFFGFPDPCCSHRIVRVIPPLGLDRILPIASACLLSQTCWIKRSLYARLFRFRNKFWIRAMFQIDNTVVKEQKIGEVWEGETSSLQLSFFMFDFHESKDTVTLSWLPKCWLKNKSPRCMRSSEAKEIE